MDANDEHLECCGHSQVLCRSYVGHHEEHQGDAHRLAGCVGRESASKSKQIAVDVG